MYVSADSFGGPSVIDIFVTNASSDISQPVSITALPSDHNPMLCQLPWSVESQVQYF